MVVKIRGKAAEQHGRKWGNYTKVVLLVVFGWGVERGYLNANPAFANKWIKRAKGLTQGKRPWKGF